MESRSLIKGIVVFYILLVFIIVVPLLAFADNESNLSARTIIERLYRGPGYPDIIDFSAEFRVKRNLTKRQIQEETSLAEFSRGKIFYKKPNKLRVESILQVNELLYGEHFIVIKDGNTEWLFKSRVDFPVQKRSDPHQPSTYLPFNFQLYPKYSQREYTLLSTDIYNGTPVYVIGITNREDPKKEVIKVWVDKDKWVPLRVKTNNTEILYKDVKRLADGRWMPCRLELYEDNSLNQIVFYDKVGINYNLPDSLFTAYQPIPTGFQESLLK